MLLCDFFALRDEDRSGRRLPGSGLGPDVAAQARGLMHAFASTQVLFETLVVQIFSHAKALMTLDKILRTPAKLVKYLDLEGF